MSQTMIGNVPGNVLNKFVREWEVFYREVFGIERDFANLAIPKRKKGFDRLIVVAKGMTPMKLYAEVKELCPAWKYWDNLDEITSERNAKDCDYAVWVRDRVKADEELKNLSATDVKEKSISGITLEERLLYELKFFKETGKHLDIVNITLCAGSRGPDGRVPCVDGIFGMVSVFGCAPGSRSGHLRSRQTVS